MSKHCLSKGTIVFDNPPSIVSYAAVGGKLEKEGPIGEYLLYIPEDYEIEHDTAENAESLLQRFSLENTLIKGNVTEDDIDFLFAGDLLNQCTASSYSMRNYDIPFIGLYSACATFAEGLGLAAVFSSNNPGFLNAVLTSSHYNSAGNQFKYPGRMDDNRPQTAQHTATASGCALVGSKENVSPYIHSVTFGNIIDHGIKDANNMGETMAYAAFDTIMKHFEHTNTSTKDYDLIITGDLGEYGSKNCGNCFYKMAQS